MKHILTILLLLISAVHTYGQHLEFMGVPIDGSVSELVNNLRQHGYTINGQYTNSSTYTFDGYFFGKNCLLVVPLNSNTPIYQITSIVLFKDRDYQDVFNYQEEVKKTIKSIYGFSNWEWNDQASQWRGYVYAGQIFTGIILVKTNRDNPSQYSVSTTFMDVANLTKAFPNAFR